MKRAPVVLMLILCACTGSDRAPRPTPTPSATNVVLRFKIVHAGLVRDPCVPGPDFATATTEDGWIDVWDDETSCSKQQEFDLPDVDFTSEFAAAARWGGRRCAPPRIGSVTIAGSKVYVDAAARASTCVSPRQAETFLAIARAPALCATTLVVFREDGKEVAHVPWTAPPCKR